MLSLLIYVIELYIFGILAIGLHHASPRIGLAPLLFLVAGIIGLLNVIELNALVIVLDSGVKLRPGGHIFVPVSLLIILMLYVVHGTRTAQIAVAGIIGVNFLVFATIMFLSIYVAFPQANAEITGLFADSNAFDLSFIRGMIASIFAFTADMLLMIIVYQGGYNYFIRLPKWIIPGIALIVALWADSVLYNIGAFVGTENFSFSVPSDILVKTLSGILLTPLIGWYLTRIAPNLVDFVGPGNRQTFSILFRSLQGDAQVESLKSELRISRSVYNQLTQHIEEIFWLIDIDDRRFIYVSPAYERISKYSVEPLYQDINNLLSIIHPDDHALTNNDILYFLTHEKDIEFRIVSPNKVEHWLRARSFPIEDEKGNIIRYAGIAEDITERKKLTEQDFELALTRERMQILHDFISDASHDLKTPISSMILKLSLLDRVEDETRRREIREELRGRALHLSNLITDLFTLSHIEGHAFIEMSEIDLNQIVAGVVQDTQMLADEKGLTLSLTTTEEDTRLEGNNEQINRVVSNLISNAIRYTPSGTVSVLTRVANDHVIMSVTDTGIGIPEESINHVFDRFFRTNHAKDLQEGTGLGLAISKAIVDKHHGTLTVISVEGEGSTFTMSLPKSQPQKLTQHSTARIEQEIRVLPPDT